MTQNVEVGRDSLPSLLLVDDDEVLRERLAQAIRARGYEVKTAGNAAEALREVAIESPEMAVLDLKMPGMSGLELLRELRQLDPRHPRAHADRLRQHRHRGPGGSRGGGGLPAQAGRRRRDPGRAHGQGHHGAQVGRARRPRWRAPSGSTSSACSPTAGTTSPRRRAGSGSTGGRCSASCTSTRRRGSRTPAPPPPPGDARRRGDPVAPAGGAAGSHSEHLHRAMVGPVCVVGVHRAGDAGIEGVDGAQHLQRLVGSATGLPISEAS